MLVYPNITVQTINHFFDHQHSRIMVYKFIHKHMVERDLIQLQRPNKFLLNIFVAVRKLINRAKPND